MGIAIGIIISLPLPVDVSTGNRARTVVTVVIKQGLIRFQAASRVAERIPFLSVGASLSKVCVR